MSNHRNIPDKPALQKVFANHRPEVLFNAAALRHVPRLEKYPEQCGKTNVHGTLGVLACAAKSSVQTFVNVSAEMTADSTSVICKATRRAAELSARFAENDEGNYPSLRLDSVLGSQASMFHRFAHQANQGEPVTLVDASSPHLLITRAGVEPPAPEHDAIGSTHFEDELHCIRGDVSLRKLSTRPGSASGSDLELEVVL